MSCAYGFPYPLHVLTDTQLQQRYSHLQLAQFAVQAGVPVVQYREKHFTAATHLAELYQIRELTAGTATRLVINDSLELALAVQADGVHLGQADGPPEDALTRLPAGSLVGVTIHYPTEYEKVKHLKGIYLGVGPVFGTQSKTLSLPPLGIAKLIQLSQTYTHPVIAIGSISPANLELILRSQVCGVAILSAFCCAANPVKVAKALLHSLHTHGLGKPGQEPGGTPPPISHSGAGYGDYSGGA